MQLRFTCPQCGSAYWGTINTQHNERLGHCNGTKDGVACNYEWVRGADTEYKLFSLVFDSQEEFLRHGKDKA